MKEYLKETESVFQTLRDASTGDLQQILGEVKKQGDESIADLSARFQKLENRVLNELADVQGAGGDAGATQRGGRALGDGGNVMKKVSSRIGDLEAQVTSTLQNMQA